VNFQVDGRQAFAYTAAHALDLKKPTMVFIHGAGIDHSLFGLQSRYFGYHGWNVLALDLPGHGRSAGPPIPTITGMADWVLAFAKNISIERLSIVGHSMGALIAFECASRGAPVERVAMIGVSYPMKVVDVFLDAARRNDHAAYDMETIWAHSGQIALGANPNPGMWMYGDMLARLRRLAPGVLYNDLKACNDYELAGNVACPALFILGQRDVMTPPKAAAELQKRAPNSKTVTLAASGHNPMAEAPDATLDALIAFFR
jgi:pimeloyl-ACP methyl ester carboxylesterase